MNSSIAPSSTAPVLPTSTPVRWSLTIWYGCRTYERIWLPQAISFLSLLNFSSSSFFLRCSSSNSRARNIFIAIARFLCCERSFWQVTTILVGICVKRTAESVLLTCWPPAPDARNVSIRKSAGLISISMLSSAPGKTKTDANDVCRRAFESYGEIRTSRCIPASARRYPYAKSPSTVTVALLIPAPSPGCKSAISVLKPRRSAHRKYRRSSISAQSCASCPPAPGCIERIAPRRSYSPLSISRSSWRSSSARDASSADAVSRAASESSPLSSSARLARFPAGPRSRAERIVRRVGSGGRSVRGRQRRLPSFSARSSNSESCCLMSLSIGSHTSRRHQPATRVLCHEAARRLMGSAVCLDSSRSHRLDFERGRARPLPRHDQSDHRQHEAGLRE